MRTRLAKIAGWVILLAYVAHTPLVFEPRWVGLYLAIVGGVSIAYVVAVEPVFGLLRAWLHGFRQRGTQKVTASTPDATGDRFMRHLLRRPLRELLLVPGEDGLFFVPLLLVGVTWWTALPVALLFGLANVRAFSWEAPAVKAVAIYIACLVVLPHGIPHVVAGHPLLDAIAVAGFAFLVEGPDPVKDNRSG